MASEPNEKIIAELRQTTGLDESDPISDFFSFLEKPIFNGELGTSINVGTLLTIVLLFSLVIFSFIIYRKKKKKKLA